MVCWATTVHVAIPQDADGLCPCDANSFGVPAKVCAKRPGLLKDFVTKEQWLSTMAGLDSAAREWGSRRIFLTCFPTQWSSACSNLNAWLADNVPREGEAATLRWEVVLYTAQAVTSAGMEYTYTAGIVLVIRTEGDDTPDPTDDSIDPRNGEVLSPDQLHARRAQRRANMLSADAADVGAPQPEIMQQDAVAPEQVAVAVRTAPTPPSDPVVTKLKQAKELLDAGVLTREEFDTLKNEFLNAGTEWTW